MISNENQDNVYYFGVFDGHGGTESAEFCKDHFPHYIGKNLENNSLVDTLKLSFKNVDEDFNKIVEEKKINAGSTASVVLIRENHLIVG